MLSSRTKSLRKLFHAKLAWIVDASQEVDNESRTCCHDVQVRVKFGIAPGVGLWKQDRDFHTALSAQLCAISNRERELAPGPRT